MSRWGPTHIDRINDWIGSDSYVEGAEVVEVPVGEEGTTYPYKLLTKASGPGGTIPAGSIVYLLPQHVGPHHAKVPGTEYPPGHEIPKEARWAPPLLSDHDVEMLKQRLEMAETKAADTQAALDVVKRELVARNAEVAALKKPPAAPPPVAPPVPDSEKK
jgi:hypothetical protein